MIFCFILYPGLGFSASCVRNVDALCVLERVLVDMITPPARSLPACSDTAIASVATFTEHCQLAAASTLLALASQHPFNLSVLQALRTGAALCRVLLSIASTDVRATILKVCLFVFVNMDTRAWFDVVSIGLRFCTGATRLSSFNSKAIRALQTPK